MDELCPECGNPMDYVCRPDGTEGGMYCFACHEARHPKWEAEQETRELLAGKRLHTYKQDTRVWALLQLAVAEIDRLRREGQ